MVRHQFEDSWRDAFKEEEIAPDESVWTKIELQLVQAERGEIKRSVVFYKRLAASLALLIMAGVGAYYFVSRTEPPIQMTNEAGQNSVKEPSASQPNSSNELKENTAAHGAVKEEEPDQTMKPSGKEIHGSVAIVDDQESNQSVSLVGKEDNSASKDHLNRMVHPLTQLAVANLKVQIKGKMRSIELVRRLPAMPAEYMNTSRKTNDHNNTWASLGASAGSYNPNAGSFSATAADAQFANTTSTYNHSSSTGTAFSVGLTGGKKIAQNWVVQTGFNYFNQSLNYTSNVASLDRSNKLYALSSQYDASLSSGSFAVTSPYTLNNTIELLSIPIQAGYMVVNRKFGFQLNTGISTDIFVRSTLVDESGQFDKFTQSAGNDSPIRPINWSGLFSTEMSYRFGDHYGLAVVPGMRYSFAPLSKPGEGSFGNALIWDVGFRLRYHFK